MIHRSLNGFFFSPPSFQHSTCMIVTFDHLIIYPPPSNRPRAPRDSAVSSVVSLCLSGKYIYIYSYICMYHTW